MKCFYHPEQDAVGMCPQCGKAACRDCMKEVGGGILCKGCIAQRLQGVQAESKAVQQDRQATIDGAQRKLKIAKIVFGVFFIFGIFLTVAMVYQSIFSKDPQAPGFFAAIVGGALGSVFVGYIAWSFFWGFPAIWRGLRSMFSKMGCFVVLNPITWLILLMVFFMVVGCFGEMYCIFGGGLSQYLKTRRVARGEA
jgi:cation transport ATPase